MRWFKPWLMSMVAMTVVWLAAILLPSRDASTRAEAPDIFVPSHAKYPPGAGTCSEVETFPVARRSTQCVSVDLTKGGYLVGVIAKFKVDEIRQIHQGGGQELRTIIASPVTGGSDENKSFWKWTPSGRLELGCVNPAASEQFKLGEEFYLEFKFPPKD